ncbi:double-strand break repair protein AddB [Paracoccus pacificus]|uniref:Double-strand break repair protein AddB n=1 Tax=Paracoccus pacificus TaxID=1463598 RepID=A0ABW4R2Q3_9RHOB
MIPAGWRNGFFGLPLGVDFARELAAGLVQRLHGQPPEVMARTTVYLNAGRTLRAFRAALDEHGPLLLPRLRLISDLGAAPRPGQPPLDPRLRRRLELGQLIARLILDQPRLGNGQSVPALAESLAGLMAEMQLEGASPAALDQIRVANHAAHWQLAQTFLRIAAKFYLTGPSRDRESRQRQAAEQAAEDWAAGRNLPEGPVIVAGSTGSHGATRLFMQAVAALPNGAVVLPGFDTDTPDAVWRGLNEHSEEHPQYRFAAMLRQAGISPGDVTGWTQAGPPAPARNALVSLALRPAPVTDQWVAEGPTLGDLPDASRDLTLIEADSPTGEAEAIATLIRQAVAEETPVTVITADQMLIRRLQSALDRWRLIADDSAGRPLSLTAPGLFLRHVAELFGQPLTVDAALTILKHPITCTGGDFRPRHLGLIQGLELRLRDRGPAFPDGQAVRDWIKRRADPVAQDWGEWLARVMDRMAALASDRGLRPLSDRLAEHLALAGELAAGPGARAEDSELWAKDAGGKALAVMESLSDQAGAGYPLTAHDFAALLTAQLMADSIRSDERAHPLIRIRGPREARTEAAGQPGGITVLAGLNEGNWPAAPAPDPWLSRPMRRDAGLLLPERQIGLSAHDFQQAIAAPRIVLTRARRDAESETICARWLNRLLNLMNGLPAQRGPEAVQAMRDRGARWLVLADRVLAPAEQIAPERRPAPIPPAPALSGLSVTGVRQLIRDPYAVYARRVLGLKPLSPLRADPDAALRGTVLHKVVQRMLATPIDPDLPHSALRDRFLRTTAEVLESEVPWPAARRFWLARMESVVDRLVADELPRAACGRPAIVETGGRISLPGLSFELNAKPDRIDVLHDGTVHVYDYKTGTPPSQKQVDSFDLQLPLEAAMVQRGAFGPDLPTEVQGVSYIQLGGDGATSQRDADPEIWAKFQRLIATYQNGDRGFTARLAMQKTTDSSDYDHLSRYGEWSMSDDAIAQPVGAGADTGGGGDER